VNGILKQSLVESGNKSTVTSLLIVHATFNSQLYFSHAKI